jgi:uncharacterized protein YdaU (DUF1376 family)
MSGSAAALSKKNKKGQPTVYPDFMPDKLENAGSVANKEVEEKKKQQKKGSAEIGSSQGGSSTAQKAKKEKRVGNTR